MGFFYEHLDHITGSENLTPEKDRLLQCERMAEADVPKARQRKIIQTHWTENDGKEKYRLQASGVPPQTNIKLREPWLRDVQSAIDDARAEQQRTDGLKHHQEHMKKFTWYIVWTFVLALVSVVAFLKSFGLWEKIFGGTP